MILWKVLPNEINRKVNVDEMILWKVGVDEMLRNTRYIFISLVDQQIAT